MKFNGERIREYSDGAKGFARNSEHNLLFEWLNCLKGSEDELTNLMSGTESEFILIGSRLEEFYTRATDISEKSSSIIRLLSGDEIVHGIESLKELLVRIEMYQGMFRATAQKQIRQIDQILNVLNGIAEPLNDFRNITGTLRTLSATTKIQSALIGKSAAGFTILADNVKKLSVLIDEKSNSIQNTLRTLRALIDRVSLQLRAFEAEQKNKIEVILSETLTVVDALNNKYGAAKSKARDVADEASDISRNIGELITSIQIHDITRQKFDRIRKNLRDLYGGVEGRMSGDDLAFPKKDAAGVENMVRDQSRLLIPMLSDAANGFQEAVRSIVNSFVAVGGEVMNIIKATQNIVGEIHSDQSTFVSEVENSISHVSSAILAVSESAVAVRELSAAIQSLTASTEDILGFVREIKGIGNDLRLISLNSTVRAEAIGSAGAPLSVVAEFVKQMSDDSHLKAYTVSNAIESIVDEVKELSINVKEGSVIEESDVADMTVKMGTMQDKFRFVNGNIIALLNDLRQKGKELSLDIETAAENIGIHKTVDRMVSKAVSQMNAILYRAETASGSNLKSQEEKVVHLTNGFGKRATRGATLRLVTPEDRDHKSRDEENENVILF